MATLEERVAALEQELARLKHKLEHGPAWWESIAGTFENDPVYENAMELGRQYRASQKSRTDERQC